MSKDFNFKINREKNKKKNQLEIYKLSSFIKNPLLFIKLAESTYFFTSSTCKDYPKYFEWYWSKAIPRIFNGSGEIIICTINHKIVGMACLKKDITESKICTLFVDKSFRKKHIATKLLELSFNYLGTSKPLASISEYKLSMFEPTIKKYDWKLTQIKSKEYYNNKFREFVFNGFLQE